jgi:hypothetical protein
MFFLVALIAAALAWFVGPGLFARTGLPTRDILYADVGTLPQPAPLISKRYRQLETLTLTVSGKGTGSGGITGTMAFDRKDYGMNSGIPFIKIADRVEVDIDLKAKQVSGPRLVYQQ